MTLTNKRNDGRGGLFITFEGPEGAGKTTQIKLLKRRFDALGREAIVTREPGGTEVAERLRDLVKHYSGEEPIVDETELLLFAASRAQHVRNLILPALNSGVIVICDRFADSTTAYQGYGRDQPLTFIKLLNEYAIVGRAPDITLLLDINPKRGFQRTTLRQAKLFADVEDRFEGETLSFHEKVRNGFRAIAAENPERVKVIDADRDEETVAADVWENVHHALGPFR